MTLRGAGSFVVVIVGTVCLGAFWSSEAQAQVKLEFKFPEGKRLTYKTTARTRQLLTFMNNMEKASVLRETKVWTRSIGKRRADSTLPIEEKVEFLRDEYTLPDGVKLTLDSSDSKLKVDNPELKFVNDIFKLESALAYAVVLDGQAKVKAIEGTEQLREKASKLESPVAIEEFQSEIETARLRTKFEQVIHIFPDAPARTGEIWERTETLNINGMTFTIRKKYEYRGTEKKGDKTLEKLTYKALEVKYDQSPKGKLPVTVVKSDLKVESSDGTMLFDREDGHTVSAVDRIRIKGNMTFSAAGVEQNGELDLNYDGNTQLQSAAK
jgi:hypothetical protein